MCSAIVKSLLPHYVRFPTGTALQEIVDGFKRDLDFLCVLEQSMDPTSPSSLLRSVQPITTTGKAGTPLSFKALLTIEAVLQMCMWAGQVRFMISCLH